MAGRIATIAQHARTPFVAGASPNLAVTGALAVILVLAVLRPKLPLTTSARVQAMIVFLATAGICLAIKLVSYDLDFARNSLNTNVMETMKIAAWGMMGMIGFGTLHPQWRPSVLGALTKAARQGVPLVAASASVGIVIGVIQQAGMTDIVAAAVGNLVQSSKILALLGIMICSIILGMGAVLVALRTRR